MTCTTVTQCRRFCNGARSLTCVVLGLVTAFCATDAHADEPVVTSVFDMEEDAFAAEIVAVEGVSLSDCVARDAVIPARGQHSLAVEIGATNAGAAATIDLRGRDEIWFDQADRVAVFAFISEGQGEVCLRIRDAAGHIFQSAPQSLKHANRWERQVVDFGSDAWKPAGLVRRREASESNGAEPAPAGIVWPITPQGVRVIAPKTGRQTVFLDDLEVEHKVQSQDTVRGLFRFDQPIQLYAPGATVGASLFIENLSRKQPLNLSVSMSWLRSDGSELKSQKADLNLTASTPDYRARQSVDFSQKIEEPGLYRLVARIGNPRWRQPKIVETGLAVVQSNRALPRGRSTLFAVRSNLIEDPRSDQELELALANEIGADVFAVETPWRRIEPKAGSYEFAALDPIIAGLTKRSITPIVALGDPPAFFDSGDGSKLAERRLAVLKAVLDHFGAKLRWVEALPGTGPVDPAALDQLQTELQKTRKDAVVLGARLEVENAKPSALPAAAGVFLTRGGNEAALRILAALGGSPARGWKSGDWWLHESPPLDGVGTLADGTSLLHHYLVAAASGIAGLMWYDLRDDTSDPHHPERMRGLVRRDFSPKGALIGFAGAAALITGAHFTGLVPNAPPGSDSWAFQGTARQLAVLFPKPDAAGQVLGVVQTLPGELKVYDAERRSLPLIRVTEPPVLSYSGPLFIELATAQLTTDFSLAIAPSWLRLPTRMALGATGTFTIDFTAPIALKKSYLEIMVPKSSGLKSSVGTRTLKSEAGQPVAIECALTREPALRDVPVRLLLNLSIEGQAFSIPMDVQPLIAVSASAALFEAKSSLGRLRSGAELRQLQAAKAESAGENRAEGVGIFGSYSGEELRIGVELPAGVSPRAALRLRLATYGQDSELDVLAQDLATEPKLTVSGAAGAKTVVLEPVKGAERSKLALVIAAKSLGLQRFGEKQRLVAGCELVDPGRESGEMHLQWGALGRGPDQVVLELGGT